MVSDTEAAATETFSRLPKTVVPSNYKLTLTPDLKKLFFNGTAEIEAEVKVETNEIILNSVDLTISNVHWTGAAGNPQIPTEVELKEKEEVLKLTFAPPLAPGQGKLSLEFTAELNDKMKGFYRSSYKGADGEDRFNAVTQFESTDARRCFPCWDEPAVKATFDVTLVVPKDRVALSNMPVKASRPHEKDPNLVILDYETTPIMSTYLLAFVVGEFDYLEAVSSDGVQCRVYTPPGKKDQGKFALDVATKTLPYYKDYFGIAYPLPKMDLVAIADFSCGAMENWGLVTYRETALLVDEKETSASSRQWVAIVVAHELAHQWFGNLVTMEWWTHLWLNEGYASFVEFMCVAHLFPDWDIWTQFVTDTHNRALELDGLKNSHPIEVPVNHPSEIDEIFDDISYSKGASVIRMLYNYIGDADFRKGMNTYLTRHQYGNTFTEDLWKALGEASSKPVDQVMSTWTKQMGYPLIRVADVVQDGNQRRLTLFQEKFNADPQAEPGTQVWHVPLAFSSGEKPSKTINETLMTDKSIIVTLDDVSQDQWVKLNPGIVGFYRVHYPSQMLNEFLPAIKSKSMPPLDRLGLLDDVFALVQAGKASTADVLKLTSAYVNEDNYTCWTSITCILGKLNLLLAYTDCQNELKAYGRSIFNTISEKVGWDAKPNEGHLESMLRALVLNRLGSFDHKEITQEANRRFQLHVSGEQPISADLRNAVYKAVLSSGDEKTFETIMKLYDDASTQEEKDRIARSMGSIRDTTLLKKVLDFSISPKVRKQDSAFILMSVSMSKDGRDLAWNFFKENAQLFKDEYPRKHVGMAVKHMAENFVTQEKALEVESFFRENSFPGTERAIQQAIESIRINESWLSRDQAGCQDFLKSYTTVSA